LSAALLLPKGDLEALRKENQTLIKQHKTLSLSSQTVDRLRLELDGARSDNITLESQMSEFRKANTDLKRQMEQWKRLEERGDEDAKAKVELEVAKEELEERLQESSRKEKESQKELRRMRSLLEDLQARTHSSGHQRFFPDMLKRKQKESDSSVLRVQKELDRAHLELRELRESSGSNAVAAARAANDSSDYDSEKVRLFAGNSQVCIKHHTGLQDKTFRSKKIAKGQSAHPSHQKSTAAFDIKTHKSNYEL